MAPIDWKSIQPFIHRNIVAVVTVPGIVLLHWYWLKLQESNKFLSKEERYNSKLPTTRMFETIMHNLETVQSDGTEDMSAKVVEECFLEPVTSDASISSLRNLITILKSCVGPKGRAKLLVTSGNHIDLTSSSGTLAERLDLQNPICRYILQTMKVHSDFGLYVGIFISSVLEQVWTMQNNDQFSVSSTSEALQQIMESCNDFFISAEFASTIDFNSVKELISIIKNLISCKRFLLLSEEFVDKLSLNIVKAFLMSIDDNHFTINRILVKAELGTNESHCYNGILHQIVDEDLESFYKIKKPRSDLDNYYILLFSIMLTPVEDDESNDSILKTVLQILQSAVELGIHVVACQKVVHKSIKLFLKRNGVLLLERMGTEQTNALKEMSSALSITDLSKASNLDIKNIKGCLTCVDIVNFNKKKYFLLENTKRTITTLIMCTSSLAKECEVKVVVEQALQTLRSIAKDPRVVAGAGCFEVWLALHLELAQVSGRIKHNVDKFMLSTLQTAILAASGLQLPVLYDTIYNHAWSSENTDLYKCNCGRITRSAVVNEKGDWLSLGKCNNKISICQHANLSSGGVVDSFLLKQNALMSALEGCLNLLSIGLVVYKIN